MLRTTERFAIFALAVTGSSVLGFIGWSTGWISEVFAAWVQAIGTIAAIIFVTLPVVVEHRLARSQARAMTLAACEEAYAEMESVASFILNPSQPRSEWWVPRFDEVMLLLSAAPVFQTGSAVAVSNFLRLHQMTARASGWLDVSDLRTGDGSSMVVSLMMNTEVYMR